MIRSALSTFTKQTIGRVRRRTSTKQRSITFMPFGCWWFLNNPSIVEEITRERLELPGTTFIPQHSDARVLEQVIYKWRNTGATLAPHSRPVLPANVHGQNGT